MLSLSVEFIDRRTHRCRLVIVPSGKHKKTRRKAGREERLCSHVLSALGLDMTDNMAARGHDGPNEDIGSVGDRRVPRPHLATLQSGFSTPYHDFSLPVAWWADPRVAGVRREIATTTRGWARRVSPLSARCTGWHAGPTKTKRRASRRKRSPPSSSPFSSCTVPSKVTSSSRQRPSPGYRR